MTRTYKIFTGFLATLIAFLPPLRAETPIKHIRVIVDTSMSLHQNDPSGLVKLSTELLFDLALKELDKNDTFKVASFDTGWKKTDLPRTLDNRFTTKPGWEASEVSAFHRKMRSLEYKAPWTYFSPCIQWAMDDLQSSGTLKDNRVIVLITDGKPDPHAIEADQKRLAELRRSLHDNNIRVFVLAFGPEVNQDWFNEAFQFNSKEGPVGEAFAGGDANHLLTDMLQIFSRSFGFSKETIKDPSRPKIDVAKNLTLLRAVVVALYQDKAGLPDFRLSAPPGKSMGPDEKGTESAEHDPQYDKRKAWRPVSYAFQWLQPPEKGEYGFDTHGMAPAEVAVLRPVRVQSTIRPYGANSMDVVMAGKPAPMEVLVSPGPGTAGDPGKDITVRFYLKYLSQDDRGENSGKVYLPDQGEGRPTPEGRVFVIRPEFIKNPRDAPPGQPYQAFIDVEVTQYDTPVHRMGALMHKVEVYPYLSVGVNPNPATAITKDGKDQIQSGKQGCAEIRLSDDTQSLKAERYTLAARIDNLPPNSGAWRGAKFYFDSDELGDSGRNTTWQSIETWKVSELTGKPHKFCVAAGVPAWQDLGRQLNVHFGLWHDGADSNERQLNVVEDLAVTASIAAPDFWQTWGPWLILLLTMLMMYLLFLLLRSRQTLAPDLGVSLASGGGNLMPATLGVKSPLSSWLGFPEEKLVLSLAGDRELGTVRSVRDELFAFAPNQGFRNVSVQSNGSWLPLEASGDGSYLVSAGKIYRAGIGGDLYSFRLEYSANRPRL
jgi:hypothetical protein